MADHTIARISKGTFPYHVSVIVRANNEKNDNNKVDDIINVNIYDCITATEMPYIVGAPTADYSFNDKYRSIITIEKCLRTGGIVENNSGKISSNDLIGVNTSVLSSIFGNPTDKTMSILCVSTSDNYNLSNKCPAIIRVIYLRDNKSIAITKESGESKATSASIDFITMESPSQSMLNFIPSALQIVLGLGISISNFSSTCFKRMIENSESKIVKIDIKKKLEMMHSSLSRFKKMYKIVCREASSLLDPPIIGPADGSIPKATHPASLTPLAASQDICLKLLSMMRTLLRSEGSALILKDPISNQSNNSSSIQTYQVIYTGDSVKWTGVTAGTFGMLASSVSAKTSLVESVMTTRRALQVSNAIDDSRYNPNIDGICVLNTPLLYIPLRGRGGSVVGVLIASKGKN